MIYVIGDSHSRSFSFNPNFFPIFLGEGKKHNFTNKECAENINLKVKKLLIESSEVKKIIFFFAEPDTRFFLGKGWKPWASDEKTHSLNIDEEIDNSVKRYSDFLFDIQQNFKEIDFLVLNVIPSERVEQNKIVEKYNKSLQKSCINLGVDFIANYSELVNAENGLSKFYYGDHVHLSSALQIPVENYLLKKEWIQNKLYKKDVVWDNSVTRKEFNYNERFGCYMVDNLVDSKVIDANSKDVDIKFVTEQINSDGFIVLKGFLSFKEQEKLNTIFTNLQSGNVIDKSLRKLDNETVDVTIFNTLIKTDNETLKQLDAFFQKQEFKEIADSYYLNQPYSLNRDIFIARDRPGSKHEALDLHFDVKPSFKFFLYLNDVSKENGAFTVVPGSHKKTQAIRDKYGSDISYEKRHLSRIKDVNPEDEVAVEAPAGSLIIFTSELYHRAGVVTKGERRVMRGHCWPIEETKLTKPSTLGKIKNLFKFK